MPLSNSQMFRRIIARAVLRRPRLDHQLSRQGTSAPPEGGWPSDLKSTA
jgi:hypothetical protein